jgi:hypothetical protein
MTPWTYSIAYRRLQQGVLIRAGRSHLVGVGTMVRLGANAFVLAMGAWIGSVPGIVVGASAVAAGVFCEAIYAGIVVRPVRRALPEARAEDAPLGIKGFLPFYVPLAMTSLLHLLASPIGAAGMGRLPRPLDSLAVWPVVNGLIFLLRGMGIAFNEVVVSLLDLPSAQRALRRFTKILAASTSMMLLLIAATPIADLYFREISGLPDALADLARVAIWLAVLSPAVAVVQSWHQGVLVHARRTRGITEAVALSLATMVLLLGLASWIGLAIPGLFVVLGAIWIGQCVQLFWLWRRSRGLRRSLREAARERPVA